MPRIVSLMSGPMQSDSLRRRVRINITVTPFKALSENPATVFFTGYERDRRLKGVTSSRRSGERDSDRQDGAPRAAVDDGTGGSESLESMRFGATGAPAQPVQPAQASAAVTRCCS